MKRATKKPKPPKLASSLERTFETLWAMHGRCVRDGFEVRWLPEPQFRFHEKRRWRLDFAWPEQKVAVELEGGIYRKEGGAHTGVNKFIGDCDKYNALSAAGWRLFRFTEKHLMTQPVQCCELVATALASPRGAGE